MKTHRSFRGILSGIILCLVAPFSEVLGAPYTEATVSGIAHDIPFSYGMPPYSAPLSDPHHVSASRIGDNLATTALGFSSTSADAAFGTHHVSVNLSDIEHIESFGDNTITQQIAASYSLQVLPMGDNILGHSIATNLSGNNLTSVNDTLTGSFSFVYGVPYEIASVLTLEVRNGLSEGTGTSTWDDVLTFQGGTLGSTGLAQFNLRLTGSLSTEKSYLPSCAPGLPGSCSSNDASMDLTTRLTSISIPRNSWIDVTSQTPYVVNVPEPSSLLFLVSGLAGLVGWRLRKGTAVIETPGPSRSSYTFTNIEELCKSKA